MIFTSLVFLFGFLPAAIMGFALASSIGLRAGTAWLIFASLVFYGFWQPALVLLISASILFNFALSVAIRRLVGRPALQSRLLWLGIGLDLSALVYYKYAFAVLSWLGAHGIPLGADRFSQVALPIGISFFTFTQIGYLSDCRDGVTKDNDFLDYVLFVTFFPHLIAGPILHNGDMMPQFADPANRGLQSRNFAPGLTMFIFGMIKKSVFADPFSTRVAKGFDSAGTLALLPAWVTAAAYSLQLYFDFSGYSDMAVGLAMMFNVRFPANFNSPYKARNIIDFWQRWHISLTRYLNQYLYNPIAIMRQRAHVARGGSLSRRDMAHPRVFLSIVAFPTITTMALAGVWHGAGLQFLVFGLLHGVYLTINHAWKSFGPKARKSDRSAVYSAVLVAGQVGLTYCAVLVGQVFFRASSVGQGLHLISGMVGGHGIWAFKSSVGTRDTGLNKNLQWVVRIVVLYAVVWFAPNTQQILASADPGHPAPSDAGTTPATLGSEPAVGDLGCRTRLSRAHVAGRNHRVFVLPVLRSISCRAACDTSS